MKSPSSYSPPVTSPTISVQMHRDLVDMLVGNIFTGLAMTLIAFSGLVFGFQNEEGHDVKVLLWGVMVCVSVCRLTHGIYWHIKLKGSHYNPKSVEALFAIGLYLTGAVWAAYSLMLFNTMTTIELASTMVVLAAMAGGAASVLAPNKWIVTYYCTALLLPMSLCALLDNERSIIVLGILGVVFWVGILTNSLGTHRFIVNTVRLREHNNDLMEQLVSDRQETAKVNEMLRETNAQLDDANANLEQQVEKRTQDIFRLSNRDPLTDLLNRNGFLKHLNALLDTSKALGNNLAILFIDLDGFKQVNDSLGHKVGDIVLAEIATRLTKYCEKDHLARWGGDEFVVVVPYATVDTAVAVAHAMRSGVTLPIIASDNQVTLDATIGIAIYPQHGKDALSLIQQADLTMYDQKRSQRGTVGVFSEVLHEQIRQEQYLCEHLRHAIARSEMSVHYQPIMCSQQQRISSVEALLRWEHQGEQISPTDFIPLAERSGLIIDIGTWVLNRACIDASQWNFENSIAVSVNVSINQLIDDTFISILQRALDTSSLSPSLLHLEITESVFAKNEKAVATQLAAIKALGVKISIDDFGTGYSSLSRLASMPCDFVKIDRSFVQNTSEGSDTIMRATMLIAQEFGCKTIAEGIETNTQMLHIKSLGVNYFQGFYYAKPMQSSDLITWYNENY